MRSSTVYTCLIVMLFISTATFGGVDPTGTGIACSASAYASRGNYEDYYYEENWWLETATSDGMYNWETTADAYAGCNCTEDGGWVLAVADASGACASPFGTVSVDAYMTINTTDADGDDPPADTAGGTDWFDANECVSGMCDAFAYGEVEEGSSGTAQASANSDGYVYLSES